MDYGKFLLLKGNDYWSEPANRTSEFGEDIASSGVLLLTDTAWNSLSNKEGIAVKNMIWRYQMSKF